MGGVDRPAHATATSELHSAFVGVLFDVGIHLSEFKLQLRFTVHIDASGINMCSLASPPLLKREGRVW